MCGIDLLYKRAYHFSVDQYYRHPDLHVRLKNPSEARIFLDDPKTWWPYPKKPFLQLLDGRRIEIDTQKMSDETAVEVAFVILDDMIYRALTEEPPFPREPH